MHKAKYHPVRRVIEADLRCLHCYRVKTFVCALGVYEGEKYDAVCIQCGSWRHRAVTGMRNRVLPLPIWEAAALGRPA